MNSVPLSVKSATLVATAFSFFFQRPTTCELHFSRSLSCAPEPNCRNARSHKAATSVIHLQSAGLSLFTRQIEVVRHIHCFPAGFLLQTERTTDYNTQQQASKTQRHEPQQTQGAAKQQSQTAGVHYTTIQMVHPNTPMQRHNHLTHYTELSLI